MGMVSVGRGGKWGEPLQARRAAKHLHKAIDPEEKEEEQMRPVQ